MRVFQTMEHGKSNKKVIFLIAGWGTKLWMFWWFAKVLEKNGYFCITYAYDTKVLSPDTSLTVKCLRTIKEDILKRLHDLKKDGHSEFSIFGTSLGSIIALMVSNESADVQKIILNTVGIDMAESIWSWDKVFGYFKKSLIQQKYTLTSLRAAWNEITPRNNIGNLQHTRILVYLAEHDEIIPYRLGQALLEEFKKKKYTYNVIVNHYLPHTLTGTYNLFHAKKYLNFLKDNITT